MPLILCIEDEPTLRADIADELREAGYEVLVAGDGASGLRQFIEHRPDLVLCDITMPGMGGFDVLRAMREGHRELADVPFLFVTALADRENVIDGKAQGADDYLTKPIDYDLMLATVKARLDQVGRLRAHHQADLAARQARQLDLLASRIDAAIRNSIEVLNHLGLGVILLGRDGAAMHVNDHARQILDRNDGLSLRQNLLHAHSPKHTQQLRQAVEDAVRAAGTPVKGAAKGDALILDLPRPSGSRPLMVRVSPLEPNPQSPSRSFAAALFVSDPDERPAVPLDDIARIYGLTSAETRLAEKLLAGHRLDAIAEMHGVSQHTISSQLKSVFRKTNTGRQAELIDLLRRPLAWYAT